MFLCRDNQRELAESTDRGPIDYLHFGLIFGGILVTAAGVVTLTTGVFVVGLLLVALGMAYFMMDN